MTQYYQKEYEQTKERVKLALLGYSAGIYEWNMLDNSAYYSDEWKTMLGLENEQIDSHLSTWANLVHPNDIDAIIKNVQETVKAREKNIETTHRLKHKNGQWIWILGRGLITYDEEGNAIKMVGIHTDITQKKLNKLKLKHQAQMIEQTHDSVISTDTDGIILTWNRGSQLLFEYTSDEIIGKHITVLQSEYDETLVGKNIEYLKTHQQLHKEIQLTTKSKKILFIDLSLSLLRDMDENIIGLIGYAQDITQRKKTEKQLEDSNYNFQQYINAMNEINIALFVVNEDYSVRYMNNTMKKWFGHDTAIPCYKIIANLDAPCSYCKLHTVIDEGKKVFYEPVLADDKTLEIVCTPIKNADGTISKMEIIKDITNDIKAKKILLKEKKFLQHQANYDVLTNLPNRLLFSDRIKRSIVKAKRNHTKIALFFLDLDYFKEINDSYGHDVGDKVLQTVAMRVQSIIREEDTFSRLAGDEFTLILEGVDSIKDVSSLAQKILLALSRVLYIKEHELYISSSIGIALYPNDAQDDVSLLKYADSAMYKAKNKGRNNFQFYDEQ